MCIYSLLGIPDTFLILANHCSSTRISLEVQARAEQAACPMCEEPSSYIHSRYARSLTDLPCVGKVVQITARLRRFRCLNDQCSRKIFCERIPQLAKPFAQCTERLQQAHTDVARAAGGEAGVRLARRLGMAISADTLLRRLKRLTLETNNNVKCIGIDDWALRKGTRYGTLIVDLHTHRPIDLLPDRSASTVEQWLKNHPSIEVISRDRAGDYAKAAQAGAPQAVQVADRWHLLQNVRQCLQRVVDRFSPALRAQLSKKAQEQMTGVQSESPVFEEEVSEEPVPNEKTDYRQETFDRVHELRREGKGIREIARLTGICRITVRRYLAHQQLPQRAQRPRRSSLDTHQEYLRRRWEEGCQNAAELLRELQDRGIEISYSAVCRYTASFREARPKSEPVAVVPERVSSYRLSWWLLDPSTAKNPEEYRWIVAARDLGGELWEAVGLWRRFRCVIRQRRVGTCTRWLDIADQAQSHEVRNFAQKLRQDGEALKAALELPWSNGVVEGHVHRVKLIKRQMYGRGGFELLRHRVLAKD